MRPPRRPLVRLVATLTLAAAFAAPAPAESVSRGYQVRDDDAARFAVLEFRRHASRDQWRSAVKEIQKLLDLPPDHGVVIAVEGARPPRYESAWRAALRLFEGLPPDGRSAWEEMYRRPAEDLLARGIRTRRDEDLAAAARRYPARDVRRRAHDALAHLATARGDFDRAARELESLLECVEPPDRPVVAARLAFTRAQEGDAEGVARVALLHRADLGAMVPGAAGPERLSDFVARMQSVADAAGRRFSGARGFGGDRHGSGLSEPPPAADSPGWSDAVPTEFEAGDESDDTYPTGDSTFRPVIPVVAQGAVFLNNGLSVTAVDLGTGRTNWTQMTEQRAAGWRDHPNVYHTAAVAGGVVYAALATRADAPDIDRTFYGRTIIYALPHRVLHALDARTGDILWAHDTPRLAGRADADEIDRESVSSPPLVVGDDVLVATWAFNTRYETRLVCFDRHTGATRWRTGLVHGQQEMNLFGRPVKELVTAPLAELDGLVYVPTGLGVAAAVDRVTGGVVWIAEHDTVDIPPAYQWYETRDRDVTWRPSPTTATRTAVVMAPLESSALFGFDPRTGAQLWRTKQRTSSSVATWYVGAHDGKAYAVGSRAFAWDLATGREAWTTPDAGRIGGSGDAARMAVGRALLTADELVVPTAVGLARLDLATGAFLGTKELPRTREERRRIARSVGDLVSSDGALVVTTGQYVDAYYRFEDLAARLHARIVADPGDPALRLEAGDVFLGAGRIDEGVSCLERGLEAAAKLPPAAAQRIEAALRHSLVDGLLARARLRRAATNGPGAWSDLKAAVETAREPGDAVRALFALADCAGETRRDADCDAALRRIATEYADVLTIVGDDESRAEAGALALFRIGERAEARGDVAAAVDTWLRLLDERPDSSLGETNVAGGVRAALDALEAARGESVAKLVDQRARTALDRALAANDVISLHRLSRTSPSPRVGAEAALAAARLHLAAGRAREAAAVLEGLVVRRLPAETLARGLWVLAGAYRSLDETPRERAALRRIVQECAGPKGTATLDDGRVAADAARTELATERFRDTPATLPDPRPPLAHLWEHLGGTEEPALLLVQVQGTRPRALEGRLLFLQQRTLRLLDGKSGDEVWTAPAEVTYRAAFGTSGSVVIAGEDESIRPRLVRLDAIRLEDGRRAWTRRLGGRYIHSTASLGLVYVLRNEPDETGDQVATITAISSESGDVVAERRLGSTIHPKLTCVGDALVYHEMVPQGATARRRIVTLDGATLAPRGAVEFDGQSSPFSLNPPGTSLLVTTVAHDGVAAVDVSTGGLAWPPFVLRGRQVKNVVVVPGGVIVSDDGDQVRRIDATTGREAWFRPLGGEAALGYAGEAADGDLVVATLIPSQGGDSATAVGLDAATGEIRWRTPIPIGGRAFPRPEILAGVVAYELNVVRKANEYDCRVVLLSRTDGSVVDTVSHASIGKFMQRALYQGPYIVLWASPRADVAVYGAGASGR